MTLHGPYIQELFTYRGPALRRMVLDAGELGCTAFATNLWAPVPGSVRALAHPTPFEGGDLSKPKSKLFQQIDRMLRFTSRMDMTPVFYGLMWPDIWFAHQRHHDYPDVGMIEYLESINYKGHPISLDEWKSFSGPARDGWLDFWNQIIAKYGNDAWYVDGTEVYMSSFGESPNEITRTIRQNTPSHVRLYRSVGPFAEHVGSNDEAHINPGDDYNFTGSGGIIATDGWGDAPSREWDAPTKNKPNRTLRYAALPPGGTAKEIADWYVDLMRDCVRDGRDACLVLHTAGWEVDRPTMHPRRQGRIWRKGDQPWHRIYGRMSGV